MKRRKRPSANDNLGSSMTKKPFSSRVQPIISNSRVRNRVIRHEQSLASSTFVDKARTVIVKALFGTPPENETQFFLKTEDLSE